MAVPICAEHATSRRMFKKTVQRGRSERGPEAYLLPYGEGPSDARTKLEGFFSILPGAAMTRVSKDRSFFLKKSGDIERVKKTGRRLPTQLFNLVSCHSDLPHARVGVIVGKRLGGAVVRNRAKRRFRELARQVRGELVPGRDLLVFPRHGAVEAASLVLREAWMTALRQQALVRTSKEG